MLHVLNGDAAREKLERSGIPGDMTVWAYVLHDGPVPDVELARQDALDDYRAHDEGVFWF